MNRVCWPHISRTRVDSLVSLLRDEREHVLGFIGPSTRSLTIERLLGKEILASLASRSMAADRCTGSLNIVFQRLPAWMRDGKQNPIISKKRPLDQSTQGMQHDLTPVASRSHPDVSTTISEEPPPMGIQRASTFPKHGSSRAEVPATSLDNAWTHNASSYRVPTPTSAPYDASTFAEASQRSAAQAGGPISSYAMAPNPALSDLSTMMFPPEDEPFGYPNQPLTTFENNQQFSKNSIYPTSQFYNSIGTGSQMAQLSRGRDDSIEAQFYPLPPYIEQSQHHLPLQSQRAVGFPPAMGYGATQAQSRTAAQAMQIPHGGWSAPQQFPQDISDVNINGLFGGGEWLPPGFPNYQG